MTRRLTAFIEREADGYVALCPELDIASQGDTVEVARDNLREALELFFEVAPADEVDRRLSGEVDLPEAATTVPVPDHSELRIGTLRAIIRRSGIPRGDFEE